MTYPSIIDLKDCAIVGTICTFFWGAMNWFFSQPQKDPALYTVFLLTFLGAFTLQRLYALRYDLREVQKQDPHSRK